MGKYLVTGACGFTGSHAVDYLVEKGEEVRATDLAGSDRDFLRRDVEFVPADLTSGRDLDKLLNGVEAIIHTAAIFSFSATWAMLKAVNVEGTENLCRAALDAGVRRIVSYSSLSVYGAFRSRPAPVTEDHPKEPDSIYGKSKHQQDETLKKFHRDFGLEYTIVRPGIVYGDRNTYGAADAIFLFARLPVVPVPFNFDFVMPLVHARDVAAAAYHLSKHADAVGQEYHVCAPKDLKVRNFISLVASVFNKPTIPVFVPEKLVVAAGTAVADLATLISRNLNQGKPFIEKDTIEYVTTNYELDTAKLLGTGFQYEFPDTRKGLLQTIDWYRQEGWLK